jgi:shikimate kinase
LNAEPLNASNIFLIGYRCTGKSSVGKLLSAKLGWPFIDTDSLLVSENGVSIKEIVDTHGWNTFRKMEHAIVNQVCILDRRVVATGGGVVLNEANVGLMKKKGRIIWLKALPETIKSRMMRDQDTEAFRPSLTSQDSFSEIEETLLERDPLYRQTMDFCVETDDRHVDEICDEIVRQLVELEPQLKEAHSS